MKVEVPREVFGVRKWRCTVRSNDSVSTFIKELVLELPEGEELNFRAGGYIQIECPAHELSYSEFDIGEEYRQDWERFKLFEIKSVVSEPTMLEPQTAPKPAQPATVA